MISDNYVTGDNIYLRELQNFFFEVLGMMSITHYGAVGDGRVDNYGPLQVAIDDAHRRGLSYCYVPYGKYIYTGELNNIEGITFMGNPHAKIVNIRTGVEIPVYQFGWISGTYYNKQEADDRFVNTAGDTMTGSLAIGENSVASGQYSFAQGLACAATGDNSHAEGVGAIASGNHSHAENAGYASGDYSHSEGYVTEAQALASHAEGTRTVASGQSSHAEGEETTASGNYSHSEGRDTQATGNYAHAEGVTSRATGAVSHAEGSNTVASGSFAHAEGNRTIASGDMAHAEGYYTEATYYRAHSEGTLTIASGHSSHAGGVGTRATRIYQTAIGKYNVEEEGDPDTYETTSGVFIVGNGYADDNRSNAFKVTFEGNTYTAGTLTQNGADYAEMMEWADGNPNNEDRVGKFVVVENDKMRIANSQDTKELMGVVSAFPTVLGDSFEEYWHGKYVTDAYGRIQYETVTIPAYTEAGKEFPAREETRPIISPNYDPTQTYIPREQRKEFGKFAMLGKLVVEDDGTCEVGGYCYPDDNGIATKRYDGFYVMARVDQNHVKIFVR